MADSDENRLPLLVQDLRQIQSANNVLVECLAWFSEEAATNKSQQMDRLGGVAYLMGLVSQQVEQVRTALKQEIGLR